MELESESKTFDYVWILRCQGKTINKNVECSMISQAPNKGIFPLIEVIDPNILMRLLDLLHTKYKEIMVDVPLYLLEGSNRYRKSVEKILQTYPKPSDFFLKNKHLIDIPVISARHFGNNDYNSEKQMLQDVKNEFDKVAVRARVPSFNLSTTEDIRRSYESLVRDMEKSDLLLLDVFGLSGYEHQISQNVKFMRTLGRRQNVKVFVLNAFEPINEGHNYGPLLSHKYNLEGFGDFATEKRFPQAGGNFKTKIIRYYVWTRFILREIKRTDYGVAAKALKARRYWKNHRAHISRCNACYDVEQDQYNRGPVYWKKFRILHYLYSIVNETMHKYSQCVSHQDLDPDGFDILFNEEEI